MRIESLSMANMREGIICAHGKSGAEEMYQQLEAWLLGDRLRGRIAREEDGTVTGFVLYYPMEHAPVEVHGEGLYMLQCLYVLPEHKGRGIARELIASAMEDARSNIAAGVVIQGYDEGAKSDAEYMPAELFESLEMMPGERRGRSTLYYRLFDELAQPPRYAPLSFSPPGGGTRLRVDILDCRFCHVSVTNRKVVENVLEQARIPGIEVAIHDVNTRDAVLDKGMSSGVFIDGKLTFFGRTITEEDVWNAIEIAQAARANRTDR